MRFFDLETRGTVDLKARGLDNHIAGLTDLTLVTWQDVEEDSKGEVMHWSPYLPDTEPPGVYEGYWVAWNSRYDRLAWNRLRGLYGFQELPLEQVLDCAAQAMASGLPPGLGDCAQVLRMGGKKGKGAMLEFADATVPMDPVLWPEFVEYGLQDTALLYPIWFRTRALSREEWGQFHASERINDRGVAVNLGLAAAVQAYSEEERAGNEQAFRALTGLGLGQSVAINRWVYAQLPEATAGLMVLARDDDGAPTRISLDSKRVLPGLIEEVATYQSLDTVAAALDLLTFARGSAVKKCKAMLDRACADDRVRGSYVLNGALTGRFSARGLQLHNFPRLVASRAFICGLLAGAPLQELCTDDVPGTKMLSRTLRPMLQAEPGNVLVWSDWSAIEARVLPWLSGGDDAQWLLDQFRDGADVYVDVAKAIYGDVEITPERRQAGKVAVLALGFGGAVGAYRAMARGYGIRIDEEQAQGIVDGWRRLNTWARPFWEALWDAFLAAAVDGRSSYAGRVQFLAQGRNVYCVLPDGRPLVYPDVRRTEDKDEEDERRRWQWTCSYPGATRGARKKLWYGTLAENVTQGTAASVLRESLVKLQDIAVAHTHDEIIVEIPEEKEGATREMLEGVMTTPPVWAKGLPLHADVSASPVYKLK